MNSAGPLEADWLARHQLPGAMTRHAKGGHCRSPD